MRVDRTCQRCSAAFTADHAVIKFGRGKHCSKACADAARYSKLTCVCAQCGMTFARSPSRVAHGRGRYCSRECTDLARRISMGDGFWTKVSKAGPVPLYAARLGPCWVWTGNTNQWGYGVFARMGRRSMSHRFSWSLVNGPIPPRMVICHRCDNPPCVRPSHLFLGTQADNVADKIAKGRQEVGRGMAKPQAKLTDGAVREIRRLAEAGIGTWSIARQFGVSPPTIYSVVTGRSWRHVE